MGDLLSRFFIDPAQLPGGAGGFIQTCFLGLAYGFVLFGASNLIKEGSELLLLVPSLAGIVGSVVLPILGAVPDGAIVLFSGLGDNAQEELSVGVGALAGSTILLLTIPWAMSIFGGRVSIKKNVFGKERCQYHGKPKLDAASKTSTETGVCPHRAIWFNAKLMILTAIGYLLIQIPAASLHCIVKDDEKCNPAGQHYWALGGMLLCFVFFVGYLWLQIRDSRKEDANMLKDQIIQKSIDRGFISLTAAFADVLSSTTGAAAKSDTDLLIDDKSARRVKHVLRIFFNRYDENDDGQIDEAELFRVLSDLHEELDERTFESMLRSMDKNGDRKINFEEFSKAMITFIKNKHVDELQHSKSVSERFSNVKDLLAREKGSVDVPRTGSSSVQVQVQDSKEGVDKDAEENEAKANEEEEEEHLPDDLIGLDPAEQLARIKRRAAWQMGVGTLLVLIFSDPMVAVMSDIGRRTNVPAFYVSFVLAPLASNASEILAAYAYSLKKTRSTITISMSTLEGAAIMNNTFCLAIFLALVFFRNLAWEFAAETLAILIVEICVFFVATRQIQHTYWAYFLIALYPISLLFVALVEYAGLN